MAGKKSGGNRKHGRNKKWCEGYAHRSQRARNKRERIMRYFRKSLRHIDKRLHNDRVPSDDKARLRASQRKLTLQMEAFQR